MLMALMTIMMGTAQAQTSIGASANWCANENRPCAFEGTKVVRFGSGTRWTSKTLTGGAACTVATFGSDPYPYYGKMCFVSDEVAVNPPVLEPLTPTITVTSNVDIGANASWCANQGANCGFTGTKIVRFGSGTKWITKTLSNGTSCTVDAFGSDPWPGWGKMCFVSKEAVPEAPPVNVEIGVNAAWCANQGGQCGFTGSKVIRFGSGTKWVTKTLTNGTACTVEAFGSDPWPGWGKMCFITKDAVATTPIVTPTPAPTPVPPPPVIPPVVNVPTFKVGVYEGSVALDKVKAYEAWLNRPMDYINDTIGSKTWDEMIGDSFYWYFSKNYEKVGLSRVVVTVPMVPTFGNYGGPSLNDVDAAKMLQDGANGAFDDKWIKLRQSMISLGYKDNIVRLGWEMNGNWYNWRANVNPTAWVAYYRRIVGILRQDPALKLRFDWNPTIQEQAIAAEKVWPGDDVVDVVGIDVYDSDWSRYPKGSNDLAVQKEVWDKTILNGPHGLKFWSAFAKQHGKPIHVDEYGIGTPEGHMGGDNPYFIQSLYDWAADPANNVKLFMYFDDPQLLPPTQFPNSSALLKKLLGK